MFFKLYFHFSNINLICFPDFFYQPDKKQDELSKDISIDRKFEWKKKKIPSLSKISLVKYFYLLFLRCGTRAPTLKSTLFCPRSTYVNSAWSTWNPTGLALVNIKQAALARPFRKCLDDFLDMLLFLLSFWDRAIIPTLNLIHLDGGGRSNLEERISSDVEQIWLLAKKAWLTWRLKYCKVRRWKGQIGMAIGVLSLYI